MTAHEIAPLFGSLLIILLSAVLAHFGRVLVDKFLVDRPPLIRELLLEAIAAAELCACCFELIIGKITKKKNYISMMKRF